jgi:hypothetical protein
MGGRKATAHGWKPLRNTPRTDDADEGGETMKQPMSINAIAAPAAGLARLRPGQGICAYPWHIGDDTRAPRSNDGMTVVLTESKLHFRWPGDPSS